MKDVNILGNYTQTNVLFFTSQGPFNLTLTNVTAEGIVFLEVEPDGSLHANRSVTEIKYEKVAVSVKKWHLNLLFPNAIFPHFLPSRSFFLSVCPVFLW